MSRFLNPFKKHDPPSYPGVLIPLQQVQRYHPVDAEAAEGEAENKPDDAAADEDDDQPLLQSETWDLASLKAEIEKDVTSRKDSPYERMWSRALTLEVWSDEHREIQSD